MARIASTTTAGVPAGPEAGMTLDALMERAKAAQSRQMDAMGPRQIQSPWQGAAQLAEAFMGARQANYAEDQVKQGRAQLAELLAGVNPETGADQKTAAQIYSLDPAAGRDVMHAAAEAIRAKRLRDQTLADRDEGRLYDERIKTGDRTYAQEDQIADEKRKAAADLAAATGTEGRAQADQIADEKRAQEAAIAEEARKAAAEKLKPQEKLGQLKQELDNKLIDPETYKAAVAKEVAIAKANGMEIEFDADGNMTSFRQGEGVGAGDSKQGQKNLANAVEDYRAAAQSANNLLPTIANMEKAFSNAGYTGPGGDWVGWFDDALEAAGSPVSLPGTGSARAVIRGGGLSFLQDQVAKSKGSISDKETALFMAGSPGLGQTREGAQMMLGIAKKVAQRAVERDAAAQQWVKAHNTLDGFEQQWGAYLDANPVIVADEQGGIRLASEAPPAPVNPANPANPAATAPSEDDIAETMRANGMTRQQVLDALAKQQGGGNGRP